MHAFDDLPSDRETQAMSGAVLPTITCFIESIPDVSKLPLIHTDSPVFYRETFFLEGDSDSFICRGKFDSISDEVGERYLEKFFVDHLDVFLEVEPDLWSITISRVKNSE